MAGSIFIESKGAIFESNPLVHLYLVYRDEQGNEFVIRGGPQFNDLSNLGNIIVEIGVPIALSEDNRGTLDPISGRGQVELNLGGRNAEDVWALMLQHAQSIQLESLDYEFGSQNSNSVIASVLQLVGINITQNYPSNTSDSFVSGEDNFLGFERDLNGTSANDILVGWNQNDTFGGSSGNDTIDGGAGVDTLSYVGLAEAVDVDMAAGNTVLASGGAIKDVFTSIEAVEGTAYGDRINGDNQVNFLYGLGGADSLYGEAGDDKLYGGAGNDTLEGGTYNDTLEGGAGNDTYIFATGDGADRIVDSDAAGSIVINGATLAGQATYVNGNQWALAAGGSNYTLSYFDDEQTLTILRNGQTSDTIIVEGFEAELTTLAARNAVFAGHALHA